MKRTIRQQEFVLELLALHVEAYRIGLHQTGRALGNSALDAVRELTDQAEAEAAQRRKQ